jgi:hypothetical protein
MENTAVNGVHPRRIFHSVGIVNVLCFILVALALISANWPAIKADNCEVGDFAANSLLVQDAKTITLLTGNYSRVGFNHPGPAILYVLALGELIFHDWLHLVTSPFSGQLVAVALFNSFWIVIFFSLVGHITESLLTRAIITSAFLCMTALLDFQFFNGIWFPHLYYFPFSVFLISITVVGIGNAVGLLYLSLSAGVLVHGHASFFAILSVVILSVVLYNFLMFRNMSPEECVVSRRYIEKNWRYILCSIGIGIMFLLPLLIQTIIYFPGPIRDYIAFSNAHTSNTLTQAVVFVGRYWGGIPMLLGGISVILLLCQCQFKSVFIASAVNMSAFVLFIATVSVLIYAKYGVDLLEHKYIALFYYSVSALTISFTLMSVYLLNEWKIKHIITAVFILVALSWTYVLINNSAEYSALYNQHTVIDLYNTLKTRRNQGRIVLDLSNRTDWGYIWSTTLGLQAYAKRAKDELVCINKNWHISFTTSARCLPDEVLRNDRFIVRKAMAVGEPVENPEIESGGLAFYRFSPPNLVGQGYVAVALRPDLFNDYFLVSGWSGTEKEFVWSQKAEAALVIPLELGFSGSIILDIAGFLPQHSSIQTVALYAAGNFVSAFKFETSNNRRFVNIPINNFQGTMLHLKLLIENPISPKSVGLSEDPRTLGVALYGFSIVSVEEFEEKMLTRP